MTIYMKIKKQILLPVLFLGAAILAIAYMVRYPHFFFGKGRGSVTMVRFVGKDIEVPVEVAREPYTWSKGLMFRESLPENGGMLFIFPDEARRSFWMKNTLIPLDMIFISRNKRVVTVRKNALPCTTALCPTYDSTADASFVLEVNAGFADAYSIREGDLVEISEQ